MAKVTFQPNPRVRQIFDDLEVYLVFCQDFGYKYDEATMYDMRDYAFRQFSKHASGKLARDCWAEICVRP